MSHTLVQGRGGEPNSVDTTGLCLLSLDGGGVRGLSTLYILKGIMDRLNRERHIISLPPVKPCEVFDLMGGTSTGGVISIMLGRLEMDVDECISVYNNLMKVIFEKKQYWFLFPWGGKTKTQSLSSRLKTAIEEVLSCRVPSEMDLFNDEDPRRCKVFVCATAKETSEITRLRSYNPGSGLNVSATICEAALATSASTSFFDPVTIGARQFVNGELGANNPVDEVEGEATNIWCEGTGDLKPLVKCFISIGTGNPGKKAISNDMFGLPSDTLDRMVKETENTEKKFIARWAKHFDEKRYFRFNVEQGLQDVALVEYEEQGKIEAATDGYLTHQAQKFRVRDCVQNLLQKQRRTPAAFASIINEHNIKRHHEALTALQEKLPLAKGAAFDAQRWEHMSTCLQGTRVDLLNDIMEWCRSSGDGPCIFWLCGMAGTGKSTIARTVSNICDKEKRLGASFFFSKDDDSLKKAENFVTTIALQLAEHISGLESLVSEVVSKKPGISEKILEIQWKHLIADPLSSLDQPMLERFVVIIDALDECEKDDDIKLILRVLAQANQIRPTRLKVFITSRPETPIREVFGDTRMITHQLRILHNVPEKTVYNDIALYFQDKLKNYVTPEDLDRLVQRADGLFIWAATASKFLKDAPAMKEKRLKILLQIGNSSQNPEERLDHIYTSILSSSFKDKYHEEEYEEVFEQYRHIVGAIILVSKPMPMDTLSQLLHLSTDSINEIIGDLHSVLNIPADDAYPIRILHLSFRDFLLSGSRCQDTNLRIEELQGHRSLLLDCLQCMSKKLRENMCGLPYPGFSSSDVKKEIIDKALPSELQYACQYWIYHLQRSGNEVLDDGSVEMFLQTHFLHWLEALSLMGMVSEGIDAIRALEFKVSSDDNEELYKLSQDARRFITKHRKTIEDAPLQIYSSALVFSPTRSIIRQQFAKEIPPWIKTPPLVQENWDPLLQTLQGHSSWVKTLAFSPDGKTLASGSDDNTVRLWDPTTGASRVTLKGHSNWVQTLAFSPDGKTLASGSRDYTVQLWDPATGTSRGTLEGHSNWVQTLAFSPDGKTLASGSRDYTVQLWDPATGTSRGSLEGHSSGVLTLAFSPDGKTLTSGSDDSTIQLWDPVTGALRRTLKGHLYSVDTLAFSPDGKTLASGSRDKTVRLWDLATGALREILKGHSSGVRTLAFLPDGKVLASGSSDNTARLWDPATGASHATLKGHSSEVQTLAFSPDGKTLASGSSDNTVRLWDPTTGASRGTLKGHSSGVLILAFSPDGKTLASGSRDYTVQLWDPATGTSRESLEGHSSGVLTLAFSPDGKTLTSGSDDSTIQLWDPFTGALCGTLKGHSSGVRTLAFSPDGKTLASGSSDNTVRLWDPVTRASRGTLKGHSNWVLTLAFSPDGKTLASGSWDSTIRLWDPVTRASRGTVKGHSSGVRTLAFSPDGKTLAFESWDSTDRFWIPVTEASRGTLKGYSSGARTLEFSPDGKILGNRQSSNGQLHLWGISGSWITYEQHNMLFLPVDAQPRCLSIYGAFVAWGDSLGRMYIIELSSDWRPSSSCIHC